MPALRVGDRVLLDDGRTGTVDEVQVEKHWSFGRYEHDVWVWVVLDGGNAARRIHLDRLEGRLDDDGS